MTTIAFDGRYIAIDSRITTNGYITSDQFNKTFENERYVCFWSGACHTREKFINAFLHHHEYLDGDYNGLYVFDKQYDEVLEVWARGKKILKNKIDFSDATGSGADHAITAMDCGLSAVDAIKMAAKRDSHTGGEIRCFDTVARKFIKVK